MNKEFEIKDDKVIVTNDRGDKIEREIVDNIEEILVTENNIEEIEKLIVRHEVFIESAQDKILDQSFVSIIYILFTILNFGFNNLNLGIPLAVFGIFWGIRNFRTIITAQKNIKKSVKESMFLEEYLHKEKEKLKELNKNKENESMYIDTSKKLISTSEEIINLKNKLYIIRDYVRNKRKYVNYYKNGILNEKLSWLSKENISFVEELIKNDLNNKNLLINDNEKAKQKIIAK